MEHDRGLGRPDQKPNSQRKPNQPEQGKPQQYTQGNKRLIELEKYDESNFTESEFYKSLWGDRPEDLSE
jgi:hypothetical protein